jgi:hypothetical protein
MLKKNPQALAEMARTLFQSLPNIEGVALRPTSVRLCGQSHQQLEMILYTEDQEDQIPDAGIVYRRDELLAEG